MLSTKSYAECENTKVDIQNLKAEAYDIKLKNNKVKKTIKY